jgi:hypothetical protein
LTDSRPLKSYPKKIICPSSGSCPQGDGSGEIPAEDEKRVDGLNGLIVKGGLVNGLVNPVFVGRFGPGKNRKT